MLYPEVDERTDVQDFLFVREWRELSMLTKARRAIPHAHSLGGKKRRELGMNADNTSNRLFVIDEIVLPDALVLRSWQC